jgi:flagella basal body P-ring formation protein FlgA
VCLAVLLGVLLGSPTLLVQAENNQRMLTQDRVIAALRQYIREHSVWSPEQVEVVLQSFTPTPLPEGEIEIDFLKQTQGLTPGRHRFLLGVQINGREEARLWIDADVKVFVEVLVTSQPLAHFEPLSPDKVRLERRNLGESPAQPFTSFNDIQGKLAARPIEVNQVLAASLVELPQVIRRGATVSLRYESVGIRVEAPGRAMEPGRVGDRIRVENPDSGKVVEGQILDDRSVRVN